MKLQNLKRNTFLLLVVFLIPVIANASPKQKMIIVKGDKSFLMQGDPFEHSANKPYSYRKDRVLPALITKGWSIKSLHVNAKSTENSLYGYVILYKNK